MAAEVLRLDTDPLPPALEELVARHHPEGLWLYGNRSALLMVKA